MSGTDDAINQGIVLASILTGFAFVIAAQFAVREVKVVQAERLANGFFLVGLLCLTAVAVGVFYFDNKGEPDDQGLLRAWFFGFLLMGGAIFLYTMATLIRLNIHQKPERYELEASIAVIVAILVVLWWLTSK